MIYIPEKFKLIPNISNKTLEGNANSICGLWHGDFFFMGKKRCLLVVNEKTAFSFILIGYTNHQLAHINELFFENLYSQFIYEGILMDFDFLRNRIGDVFFIFDESASSKLIDTIKETKTQFRKLGELNGREISKTLNAVPKVGHTGKKPNTCIQDVLAG